MAALDGDYFVGETFADLELTTADLGGKEFERCTFRHCKLPESRWVRSVLEDSVFEDCDLSRMEPQRLVLRRVVFRNTKLVGVTWKGVDKGPTMTFEDCDLRYASFVSLRLASARMVRCLLRESNFLDTDLTGADFSRSDLTGSTIQGCTLTKADFTRATGVLFDPSTNLVKGARVAPETALLLAQSFGLVVEVPDPEPVD
jgi:uncharacterized protein YjbI with pentapeptide repeats